MSECLSCGCVLEAPWYVVCMYSNGGEDEQCDVVATFDTEIDANTCRDLLDDDDNKHGGRCSFAVWENYKAHIPPHNPESLPVTYKGVTYLLKVKI